MSSTELRQTIAKAVRAKLRRIRDGEQPRVLDLFSGCGGIALGFERAGAEIVGGVERDPDAAASFKLNFHGKRRRKPSFWLTDEEMDITAARPARLARKARVRMHEAVDVLVGGPPCQAFSRIGRAKLRSVSKDPEAWLNDPRKDLYKSYLRFVAAFAPCAIMMENVPDFLTHGEVNTAEAVCENLAGLGYRSWYTLMNASSWGVPQHRERMILVAVHRSVKGDWSFPLPTRSAPPPTGYRGTRAAVMGRIGAGDGTEPGTATHFLLPTDDADGHRGRPPEVSVRQAIGDLPRIPVRKIGPRFSREDHTWSYRTGRVSDYARSMRDWPRHGETADGIADHVTRYLPRDFSIFRSMKPGEEYPAMHRRQTLRRNHQAAKLGAEPGSYRWRRLTRTLIPPYPADKFPNKWWRLVPGEPSRTLLAHLGKDGYTHIHPFEGRVISVREAARLQSFPDGFRFSGSMNSMFRQIGNAVPPLLARAVARSIFRMLRKASRKAKRTGRERPRLAATVSRG